MRSITASQDSPVASVTDTSSRASRNRLPPSAPKPASSELPTNRPRMPPPPADRSTTLGMRSASRPVAETRKPTMPTRRRAGPRSASPSPSLSMPNNAIQATPASISGSR
jgi:hypothetical protein